MLEIILPQLKDKVLSIHVVDIEMHREGSGESMSRAGHTGGRRSDRG